jgi:hypothetical protein
MVSLSEEKKGIFYQDFYFFENNKNWFKRHSLHHVLVSTVTNACQDTCDELRDNLLRKNICNVVDTTVFVLFVYRYCNKESSP